MEEEQYDTGNLVDDKSINDLSKTYIVEEMILREYLQHPQFLEINKRKRTEEGQRKMLQASQWEL